VTLSESSAKSFVDIFQEAFRSIVTSLVTSASKITGSVGRQSESYSLLTITLQSWKSWSRINYTTAADGHSSRQSLPCLSLIATSEFVSLSIQVEIFLAAMSQSIILSPPGTYTSDIAFPDPLQQLKNCVELVHILLELFSEVLQNLPNDLPPVDDVPNVLFIITLIVRCTHLSWIWLLDLKRIPHQSDELRSAVVQIVSSTELYLCELTAIIVERHSVGIFFNVLVDSTMIAMKCRRYSWTAATELLVTQEKLVGPYYSTH
jgi:hypothetical protein